VRRRRCTTLKVHSLILQGCGIGLARSRGRWVLSPVGGGAYWSIARTQGDPDRRLRARGRDRGTRPTAKLRNTVGCATVEELSGEAWDTRGTQLGLGGTSGPEPDLPLEWRPQYATSGYVLHLTPAGDCRPARFLAVPATERCSGSRSRQHPSTRRGPANCIVCSDLPASCLFSRWAV